MPKQLVDQGGLLLLGAPLSPAGLFDGTKVHQATLVRMLTVVDMTASGDTHAREAPLRRHYELSGTLYTDGVGAFALGDTCWATYYSRHATSGALDKVLFAGAVVVTKVADTQTQGEYETQEITVRSTGTPTKPPYTP